MAASPSTCCHCARPHWLTGTLITLSATGAPRHSAGGREGQGLGGRTADEGQGKWKTDMEEGPVSCLAGVQRG